MPFAHSNPSYFSHLLFFSILLIIAHFGIAQYYNAPMMTGSGCVATANKLYSHGNFIRELNGKEMAEMEKYKRELLEWKQRVDEAYARLEAQAIQRNNNSSSMPVIPPRPILPSFCTSNQTTLYILAGCTVQNHKVYIAGKFARELTDKEKAQLDEFARQMLAQQMAATATGQQMRQEQANSTSSFRRSSPSNATIVPSTTTISPPMNDIGRQIALDFCMEF